MGDQLETCGVAGAESEHTNAPAVERGTGGFAGALDMVMRGNMLRLLRSSGPRWRAVAEHGRPTLGNWGRGLTLAGSGREAADGFFLVLVAVEDAVLDLLRGWMGFRHAFLTVLLLQ